MGLFDALRGRRSADAAGPSASTLSAPELEGDRAGSAVDHIAASTSSAAAAAAAGAGIELPTGERLYNPYEGLAAAVDGRGMRGQYRLPAQVRGMRRESGQVKMMRRRMVLSFSFLLLLLPRLLSRSLPMLVARRGRDRINALLLLLLLLSARAEAAAEEYQKRRRSGSKNLEIESVDGGRTLT